MNVKQIKTYMVEIGGEYAHLDDRQGNLFDCSWSVHEGFKNLQEQLDCFVPFEGKCEGSRSYNKALETYRVASNLVYDLFNNGLMNRKGQFKSFFGWAPYGRPSDISSDQFKRYERMLEPVMTQIMQEAAIEQGVR
tara:strand:+ start:2246 stop:2653 length:408 start_codon:yes stop_codon:yes gene_type:complete